MKNNYTNKKKTGEIIWLLQSGFFLLAILLFSMQNANAQLTGWKYRDGINVHENAGAQKLNYQVLLTINTAALVTPNKMNIKGNDIRFSKDCNGSVLLNYFIDSLTMNTANTQIWVELDTLKANGDYLMYMWYGNSTAAAASNFNNTFPLTTQLVVPTGTVTISGTNNYSWFEIAAGAMVVITPGTPCVINARQIKIAGILNGNGGGYAGGQTSQPGGGPGGGKPGSILTPVNTSGGGGAYGGNGGNGNVVAGTNGDGGVAYGNTTTVDMGSGGGGPIGGGAGATDGYGGAAVTFNAREVEITGAININGNPGTSINGAGYGGGGGAGGGFLLHAYHTILSGQVNAKGAIGGSGAGGGGGGGGGRINLYSELSFTPGTYNVGAGLQGPTTNTNNPVASPGSVGVIATGTYSAQEPTYTFVPHVMLTSSSFPICQGSTATFTASAGFTPYKFYVDTAMKQNSASTTFSSSTLANNDTIKVLAGDANGCLDTSNIIIASVNPKPTITLSPATTICSGNSTPLTASGGTTYSWGPATGLSSTSGPSVNASPTATTQYTVTVTDANSCQNSDTVTVTVNGCLGIQHTSLFEFHSYPNPNHGIFTIEANFADGKDVTISICNVIGETIKTIESGNLAGSYKKDVSMNDVPDGVYFLTLKTRNGSQVKKIIKN